MEDEARWSSFSVAAPSPPFIKVNVDAAVRNDYSAVAAIFRNSDGKVVHGAAGWITGDDPTACEAEAMKMGVEEAVKSGFRSIVLEGDSKRVIDAINQFPRRIDWHIHDTIREIIGSLVRWTNGRVSTLIVVQTMLCIV